METETAATPAGGDDTRVETTASAPVETEAQAPAGGTELENLDDLAPEALAAPDAEEFEEIERGDKKYRIPKELKGEFLMNADYTRKTMELADQRRALDAVKAEVEQAKTLTTQERRAYGKLEALNESLQQYEQIDWDAYEASNPAEAQRYWRQYQTLKDQRQQLTTTLQAHEAQKTQRAQQEAAKRRSEVEAVAAKEIPNWTVRRTEIEAFAAKHGYTPEALAETASANDYKLLHLAEIGSRFIERQRAAAKAAAAGAVKPAPEVGGTAGSGSPDPSRMSMDEYASWRAANP